MKASDLYTCSTAAAELGVTRGVLLSRFDVRREEVEDRSP
jgi:hypothetical protein